VCCLPPLLTPSSVLSCLPPLWLHVACAMFGAACFLRALVACLLRPLWPPLCLRRRREERRGEERPVEERRGDVRGGRCWREAVGVGKQRGSWCWQRSQAV
jgi:hypothetical protein